MLTRLQKILIDASVVLMLVVGMCMFLATVERHARASVVAAKVEAKVEASRSADISPKEYQALMTHPVGGCEQFIQKCGDGRCRVYPVCADVTQRKHK